MKTAPTTPIVALVGRPNVGKSTLFNRYAGGRRALVEDTPGLTRDRLVAEADVAGRPVRIVDTAGLDPEARGGAAAAAQAQARAAVEEADAVLLVVDGRAGLLPEDEALARELRRSSRPVGLAVNKIDTPKHLDRVAEFHRLGLEPMAGISAEHGSGAWDLLEELVAKLPAPLEIPEGESGPDDALPVALVGRPNVGKSSLLNRLAGEDRVAVSEEPGTTRDAVDLRIETGDGAFVMVDTAGLRRAGRRDRLGERASAWQALRALERAPVALVVMDASEGVTEQDARIASLARESGCATVLVLNKWDLVKQGEAGTAARVREEVARRLRFLGDAPVLAVSARTGAGVREILPAARRLAATAGTRIPTAELNRWLRETVAAHEPAMAQRGTRRRPLKFFYATQTGVQPPSFALFCTDPQAVMPSYRRYLEKRLRERFGLEGAPVRLMLRARREEGSARGARGRRRR